MVRRKRLADQDLRRYLRLYKDNYKLISEAYYGDCSLHATLVPFTYDFTTEDLDYITATQINLYLSQLTYVLVACTVEGGDHPIVPTSVSEAYFERMHAGRLFFLENFQRMRDPIWKTEPITAEIKIEKVRRISGSFFAFLSFSINHGKCHGELKIGMKE